MAEAPRQLQTSTNLQACIPFNQLRTDIIEHPNTESICLVNSGSGCNDCCRVFEWLVCENNQALTHLPCVCDPPTETPTTDPTDSPTRRPTRRPTARPTSRPTDRLTASPTPRPTIRQTLTPTISAGPSGIPSSSPTTLPPTNRPSVDGITLGPTAAPIVLLQYTTVEEELDDGSTTISSLCNASPPTTTTTWVNTTYSFSYNIYREQDLPTINNTWNEEIHRFVAARFFDCDVSTGGLWEYESPPHIWMPEDDCTTSTSLVDDELFCEVWSATETIGVAMVDSSNGSSNEQLLRRRLQQASNDLVDEMNNVIQMAMEQNLLPNLVHEDGTISQLIYANGPIIINGGFPTPTPTFRIVLPTPSPTLAPTTSPTRNTTPTSQANRDPTTTTSSDDGGLSTNVIIVLGVLAAGLVLALVLLLVTRGRQRRPEDLVSKFEDSDYDDQELLYPTTSPTSTDNDQQQQQQKQEPLVEKEPQQPQQQPQVEDEKEPVEPEVMVNLPSPTGIKSRSFPITLTTPQKRKNDDEVGGNNDDNNGGDGDGGGADIDAEDDVVVGQGSPRLKVNQEPDIHTSSSPGKRSQRSPLSAMDELDRAPGTVAYDVATFSPDSDVPSQPRSPNAATDTILL